MRMASLGLLAILTLATPAHAQSLIDCQVAGNRLQIYKVNPSPINLACTFSCSLFDQMGKHLQTTYTAGPIVYESYSSSVIVGDSKVPDGVAYRIVSAKCKPSTSAASTEVEEKETIKVK